MQAGIRGALRPALPALLRNLEMVMGRDSETRPMTPSPLVGLGDSFLPTAHGGNTGQTNRKERQGQRFGNFSRLVGHDRVGRIAVMGAAIFGEREAVGIDRRQIIIIARRIVIPEIVGRIAVGVVRRVVRGIVGRIAILVAQQVERLETVVNVVAVVVTSLVVGLGVFVL